MTALESGVSTHAVAPPIAETCAIFQFPVCLSLKYIRDPSLTTPYFDWPSSVSCVTDSTTGTAGGMRHHAIKPPAASATTAATAAAHAQRERPPRSMTFTGELPESDRASSAKARSCAE